MSKNVFIGVAWPYVNGDLHIGHLAGYLLPADICARYQRLIGNSVLMASGSDCHGTPITVEADKRGVSPKEVVEEYHEKDVHLFREVLHLTYDIYTRTDTAHHAKVTQDIFIKLLDEGYVFIDTSKQYYSSLQKRFLPDRYVVGICPYCGFADSRSDQCDSCGKLIDSGSLVDPKSNITGDAVELKDSQHYYLDWSKLSSKLGAYVDRVGGNWKQWVLQETRGWLTEGLKPRAITRDIDWGVRLPVERIPEDMLVDDIENKRFYVWFDAVIGYLSASMLWSEKGNGDWRDFWYDAKAKHYYFMGKDNLVFHTLFWPGKLMIYDPKLHLPDVVSINMFLNLEGKQFSKSRGVVISSKEMVGRYGNDRVRFYLTLTMPETKDSSFTWADFGEKVNGILIANIGNYIHRCLSIFNGVDIENVASCPLDKRVGDEVEKRFANAAGFLETCEFRKYLDEIINLASFGNGLFDEKKVWELDRSSANFYTAAKQLYSVVISLAYLSMPVMPESSERLFGLLGMSVPNKWPSVDDALSCILSTVRGIDSSIKPHPLFEKVELE